MTPAARISAAIGILDAALAGENVERVLTNWGRGSRFAGSGDRAAVRDLVYDALRCRRSYAALGGGEHGRGLMLGALRAAGTDPSALFTGDGHAPPQIGPGDLGRPPEATEAMDMPDWLIPELSRSLEEDLPGIAQAMRRRAPVFLRVNTLKTNVSQAVKALLEDGIVAQPHALADTALEVTEGARKIQTSQAYVSGLVELQDASSQAVVATLPLRDGMKVLDHCAGGGGKTLAMAAIAKVTVFAHDANPTRMRDLPSRAARAGASLTLIDTPEERAPFDLILADVPCSGSGSWRRDPQGKWTLTPDRLHQIGALQDAILDRLAPMVGKGGVLAYATCSLLRCENDDRIAGFLARTPGWTLQKTVRLTPMTGGDGFFLALLTRQTA